MDFPAFLRWILLNSIISIFQVFGKYRSMKTGWVLFFQQVNHNSESDIAVYLLHSEHVGSHAEAQWLISWKFDWKLIGFWAI